MKKIAIAVCVLLTVGMVSAQTMVTPVNNAATVVSPVTNASTTVVSPVSSTVVSPVVSNAAAASEKAGVVENVYLVDAADASLLQRYNVVVGSFSVLANAQQFKETLKKRGLKSFVVRNDKNMYRVIAQSSSQRQDADVACTNLGISYQDCKGAWILTPASSSAVATPSSVMTPAAGSTTVVKPVTNVTVTPVVSSGKSLTALRAEDASKLKVYNVMAGAYSDLNNANARNSQFLLAGYNSFVAVNQKGLYCVVAGSFATRAEATQLMTSLNKLISADKEKAWLLINK